MQHVLEIVLLAKEKKHSKSIVVTLTIHSSGWPVENSWSLPVSGGQGDVQHPEGPRSSQDGAGAVVVGRLMYKPEGNSGSVGEGHDFFLFSTRLYVQKSKHFNLLVWFIY